MTTFCQVRFALWINHAPVAPASNLYVSERRACAALGQHRSTRPHVELPASDPTRRGDSGTSYKPKKGDRHQYNHPHCQRFVAIPSQ